MSQNSKERSDTSRLIGRQPGVLRLIRRRVFAVTLGALTVMLASILTAVQPAAASDACPGSVGVNRVVTIRPVVAQHNGSVPGLYQVFSDACVAQTRATGLDNLASQQNTCIGIGTAASGAGGLSSFFTAIAGTAATGVSTVLFPLTGVGGVFMIGVCITIQQNIGNLARHIRGAAQACGNLGIVYEFGSNQGSSGLDNQTFMQNIRCQNGQGGVGQRPPTVPGLDWDNSNNAKVLLGRTPLKATPRASGGHESVCIGGVATGATHYVDVPSPIAGVSWTYLSRQLQSRASNATSATYTVKTWNRNTGLYDATKTVTYDCFKPNTPTSVSQCTVDKPLYFSPPNSARTSYTFLRRSAGTSNVSMKSTWNHVTGLYDAGGEYYIACPDKYLSASTITNETVSATYGIPLSTVVTTRQMGPVNFRLSSPLPPDSTVVLTGVPQAYPPNSPNFCNVVWTGNPEKVSATVNSTFPGYPKVISLPVEFIRGTEIGTFSLPPGYTGDGCKITRTWVSEVTYKLS